MHLMHDTCVPRWWPALDQRQLDAADGRAVARRLLAAAGLSPGPRSVWRLCNAGAIDVYGAKLTVGSAEALIMPSGVSGRLVIHADDRPQPVTSHDLLVGEGAPTRFLFRVAHELGHALTFDRRSGEIRRLTDGGPREEAFCDDFAFGLLCPAAIGRVAAAPWFLPKVGRATCVPLRLLARELTALRPDLCIELREPTGRRVVWVEGIATDEAPARRCKLRGGWHLLITAPTSVAEQLPFQEAA